VRRGSRGASTSGAGPSQTGVSQVVQPGGDEFTVEELLDEADQEAGGGGASGSGS